MKKFSFPDFRLLFAGVVGILVLYAAYSFVVMPRPKGLKTHPPGLNTNPSSAKISISAANQYAFSRLNPASFSASFGLEFFKEVPAVAPVDNSGNQQVMEKIDTPVDTGPKLADLSSLGYKLKGIALEKDGNSAVFVFDPSAKRTVVAREKASGTIKILEVSLRSVKLLTPDGEGYLELESAKGAAGSSIAGSRSSAISIAAAAANQVKEKTLRQTSTSASGIADLINAGHLQVRRIRGNFNVDVKNVPDSFAGYGLRRGDQIIGTANEEFKRSQDVALKLGQIADRPVPLKIMRDRKVLYLNPPPPKASKENKPK